MGKKDQTTETKPYWASESAMQNVIARNDRLWKQGKMGAAPYEGQRFAGMSGQTEGALDALSGGTGIPGMAAPAYQEMLDGGNTYRDFDAIRSTVADDVKAQLGSTFSGGSINSGLAGDTYTRALTEALAGVEYGAYNDAQNRKMGALGLAPSLSGAMIDENKARLGAGMTFDQYAQGQIDADRERYEDFDNADINALKEYANIAMGVGGMGGTSSTDPGLLGTLTGIGRAASGIGSFWSAL